MNTIQTLLEKTIAEQERSTDLLVRELTALSNEFTEHHAKIQSRITAIIDAAKNGYAPSLPAAEGLPPLEPFPSVVRGLTREDIE